MTRQLAVDNDSSEAVGLRGAGLHEACPFCRGGKLEAIGATALLGVKRQEKSELYGCAIMRCDQCGHMALFDSLAVQAKAAGRTAETGGEEWT